MGILYDNFGFRALWTPELLVGLAFIGILYFLVITKWRNRFKNSSPVKTRQKIYFVLALIALYIGWGSPLYLAGHIMISFHMTQMVFAYFIAAPLFLLAIPTWFFQALIDRFRTPVTERVFRVIWSPIVALFLFNGLFSFYHVPLMFDTLMQAVVLHSFYEYLLMFAALLMWWHMIAPLPNAFPLSDLRRVGYIFANGILITPACALIIFAGAPLYQTYTDPNIWASVMAYCLPAGMDVPMSIFQGPDSFAFLETRMDQQLAGVLMKIMQEITYGITIGYVFKQWLKKEKQQDGELTISDIPIVKS
ncbi:cytochrome c oxidase assembly factor CtaG [Halalkalibacter akibai]|uniref:CtaG protein n=1 Tax=Halalkalibacter akibai (strain ATCC 43226 / DSM 21942 / CIP 109018 / JCM 9157 / 1139) TaxID=1236973 RepID=W4QVT8_HALA3|nr:cytochrome c oxidase assembly factor CtaG [Halalkalibacter akibai]GAE35409.1 CtaG protein [Halalkalibacter akibai JCM 9157]